MKVGFIIPTRNEEKSIGKVLSKIPFRWKKNVIVVDSSEDKTPLIAKKFGARVIKEKKRVRV
jgi:glycosyltransferase involved in cell wall biosynthesis